MLKKLGEKIFGTSDDREIKKMQKLVNKINEIEPIFEKLTDEQKKPVGDFHFYNGKWILINRRLPELWDKDTDTKIEIGQFVELTEGKKILLGKNDGDRLIIVQLVNT